MLLLPDVECLLVVLRGLRVLPIRLKKLAQVIETRHNLLMILAEHDQCTFTEVQREVYRAAPEPKKLLSFDGGHFDAYTTFFEQTAPPARDWFVEHLGVSQDWQASGGPEPVSESVGT